MDTTNYCAECERLTRERDEARDQVAAFKTDNYRINRHRDELAAKLARVVEALEALLPPDAEEYRTAEGDNVTLDRYWIGWVGAVDQALTAAKGE